MRRHRPLGDEQPGCDLLVAETLGNQLGDLDFAPREGSGFAAMRRGDLVIIGFTKREPHCGLPGQAFARLKFSSELRLSQSSGRRLSGLGQGPGMRSTVVSASTGGDARRCPEQLGRTTRMARPRGMIRMSRQQLDAEWPHRVERYAPGSVSSNPAGRRFGSGPIASRLAAYSRSHSAASP